MADLMAQIGWSGKKRCAVRCGVSGKRRDAAGGPIWTTEGRFFRPSGLRCASLMMRGITALGAPCRKAGKTGEMGHSCLSLVSPVTYQF